MFHRINYLSIFTAKNSHRKFRCKNQDESNIKPTLWIIIGTKQAEKWTNYTRYSIIENNMSWATPRNQNYRIANNADIETV